MESTNRLSHQIFKIPEPHLNIGLGNSIEFNTLALSKWRNTLPMADVGATAKKIFDLLNEMNQVKIQTTERFNCLEILRPVMQYVCQGLKKYYLNQSTPLHPKNLMVAKLAQTLQAAMVLGYKLISNELVSGTPQKTQLSLALQRIIAFSTGIALRNFQLYSPMLEGICKDVNQCYQIASSLEILQYNCIQTSGVEYTLADSYKHFLLLICLDPYKFPPHEMESLHISLDIWSKFCKLSIYSGSVSPQIGGVYAIDLNHDIGPVPVHLVSFNSNESYVILETQGLITHLETIIKELDPNEISARLKHSNEPEYLISSAALKTIAEDFSKPRQRDFSRENINTHVEVCIGFSNSHLCINDETEFKIQNSNLGTSTDSENNTTSSNFGISIEDIKEHKEHSLPMHSCGSINQSEQGFCLIWKEEAFPPIQAGDLLAFRIKNLNAISGESAEQAWQLGVLKWLKHSETGLLKLGISKIGLVSAVGVQILKDNKPSGYYLKAFFFQEKTNNYLITTTIPFKVGHKLDCINHSKSFHSELELKELIKSAVKFKVFKVEKMIKTDTIDLNKHKHVTKTDPTQASDIHADSSSAIRGKPDEFESIWGNI
ncbi:MAG: hypothetical protein ACKOAD_01355 [Gammaproteobacteria bacterium]